MALTECLQEERKPTPIGAVRRQFRMTLLGPCYVFIQHPAQQIRKGNRQKPTALVSSAQPGFSVKSRKPRARRTRTSWRGGDRCARSNRTRAPSLGPVPHPLPVLGSLWGPLSHGPLSRSVSAGLPLPPQHAPPVPAATLHAATESELPRRLDPGHLMEGPSWAHQSAWRMREAVGACQGKVWGPRKSASPAPARELCRGGATAEGGECAG